MPRNPPNLQLQEKINAIKRDQILEAAKAVFAEKDFHRATIKDVATRAGVADGTVYNYFKNKNALLLGLMNQLTNPVVSPLDDINPETLNLEHLIRTSIQAKFAQLDSHGLSLLQAVLPEVLASEQLRQLYRERIIEPTFTAAQGMIEIISAKSGLTTQQVTQNLQLEAAMFLGLSVLRIIDDGKLEQNLEEAMTDLMLKAFAIPVIAKTGERT